MRALYAVYGARALGIVSDYARLRLAAALTERRAPGAKIRTRVAGWRVTAWGYGAFSAHFGSKFVDLEYRFTTDSPRPFIIDCGANIGTAVLFFKTLYPAADIVAFEPDPRAFEALEANVRDNHLANVSVHQSAVGGVDGRAALYVGPAMPGTGQASLYAPPEAVGTTEVDVVRVSGFVDRPVDFLKIDVEGAEMDVLRDLVETGKLALVRQMVIEYHHHLHPEENRMSELFHVLEDAGFGYVIRVPQPAPYRRQVYQDILVYAYQG